jgi:glycosyltransferase involved in cell wall biosynthesis
MGDPSTTGYPTVSVALTTFNRKELLSRALHSVLTQSLPPNEIIVCDDGSTDGTQQELAPEFPSIVWLKQENKGVASARNLGIRHARGSWIALLDSDDEWKPEKLELQLECMKRNPRSRACHTD